MDIKLLDEADRLEKAATPGPWYHGRGCCGPYLAWQPNADERVGPDPSSDYDGTEPLLLGGDISDEDLALIAFLRTHAPTLIADAREGVRLRAVYKRCEVCERTVDTRETTEGGDPHGCQLESGEWVCSRECYEAALTPTPEPTP